MISSPRLLGGVRTRQLARLIEDHVEDKKQRTRVVKILKACGIKNERRRP